MRCSDTGHVTHSYDMAAITLQKLASFVVSIFDILSLVYRFISRFGGACVGNHFFFCMPSVMFSNISHALK